jgi:hypothetical protein
VRIILDLPLSQYDRLKRKDLVEFALLSPDPATWNRDTRYHFGVAETSHASRITSHASRISESLHV